MEKKLKQVSKELERLIAMTPSLPPPTIVLGKQYYETDAGGRVSAKGLMKEPGVAIQNAHFKNDETFIEHGHEMLEILIVWQGEGVLTMGGKDIKMVPGSCVSIPAKTPHSFVAIKGTSVIGVTIPAEEAYPDAP
jgi:quercetin dioxygenase-like cupin family protein